MFSSKQSEEKEGQIAELKKALSLRSETISVMAHQLRTRLSATKWILAMFVDGDYGKLPNDQFTLLKRSLDAIEDSIKLSSELLALNHAEEVSSNYVYKKANIVKLLDDVLFDFSGEAYKKHVAVLFPKPDDKIPDVEIDEDKIKVVFQNIIENAIKYSESGDQVTISVQHIDGDGVDISIRDTGIGISTEEQPKIFEKFFRAKNARAKEEIGSGLGLHATKTIVENHKGTLRFESEEKMGTTFFINLPITQK